ncbi:sulfated surface glycoprotein 185-like [Anopheles arabiensis]|uniref:Uncharacterized protein n=5 Tax=gambiae species complex TaxID=44542 RepID=A0A0E3W286_ANOGA|nr:sulfated surface glycoprotein 185-like [Anopheles arabiensis]XP_040226860.1 uncharacterized protein LOC120951923 [Anopheles coluzzii]XP_061504264.1 uncharacterized protein LOC133391843 [Anopheles gambiae]
MRFLIVLAMLAAVAVANPLISIRVNVESPDGEVRPPGPPGPPPPPPPPPGPGPDPEQPPPQPYSPNQLKRDVLPTDADVVFPANEPNPAGTLVNIEVFVDNQRQGNVPIIPDYPPPQPY